MFLLNAIYLYNQFKVLNSEKIDIKTFLHETVGSELPDSDHQALDDFHYFAKLPQTKKNANPTKPCRICTKSKVRKKPSYFCKKRKDKPVLCVNPWFRVYH